MARDTRHLDFDSMRARSGEAARLLKALANEQRLRVLCLLAEGEQSVGQLNERVELSQSALSQHLAKLREEGLVATRREGKNIYYSLARPEVRQVIESLHSAFCAPDRPR